MTEASRPPWKMPPIAKVYEGLTAVADGRVTLLDDGNAQVQSSDRRKTYDVTWSPDGGEITANDNASYWQGYVGYPIIAILLTLGRLDCDPDLTQALAGVPWKRLNTQFKRDYARAIEHVLSEIAARGGERLALEREAERILAQLRELGLKKGKRGKGPPKGKPAAPNIT